ncbi:MAG: hypothetical protein [Siphoviridae sp. ctpQM7]|nr:MAG: hypothetical protein [Siphoviridae sp. ctpQM7]
MLPEHLSAYKAKRKHTLFYCFHRVGGVKSGYPGKTGTPILSPPYEES